MMAWRESSLGLQAILFGLFLLCAWLANRNVCPGCGVEDFWLELEDDIRLRARLYVRPTGERGPLPAVVVSHGYLANLAFMEIPWAADLANLGVAALFLDRRGHGWSGGEWWMPPPSGDYEREWADLAAALEYLRQRAHRFNPERIGIVGHSDGATAAIIAASLDWNVAATVALSASVAPWELVNHVAPRDLLLLYRSEDDFILDETDTMLISRATRDYLEGPGEYGMPEGISARRLIKIPGHGHVTLIHSRSARRETLEWLRDSLQADGNVALSPLRIGWSWAGALVLLVAVATPPLLHGQRELARIIHESSAASANYAPSLAVLAPPSSTYCRVCLRRSSLRLARSDAHLALSRTNIHE